MPIPKIIVIGGGLAGMAAAVALGGAGHEVTLIEARKSLGGRAGSFEDPQTGEELDNCQHVLLGCCTNLIDFYKRLGVDRLIKWERTVYFVDGQGKQHDLYGTPGLPAPLHLSASMAGFGALSWGEKLAFTRAMFAMLAMGREGRQRWLDKPFGQWLDELHQPPSLVKKMYDPILISALNEESRRAGGAYAIQVFQEAMLGNSAGYLIGLPNCPLARLYERLPNAHVRMPARVKEIHFENNRAAAVELTDGQTLRASAIILATNHHAARKWIPATLAAHDARFARLEELQDVPILGVHLWFDRPIMHTTHAALIEGPLQWLFRKDDTGQSVHGVISAARDWTGISKDQCLAQFEQQIRQTFPAAQNARLERGVIVIEKRATFSPGPGVDHHRPAQAPPEGGIQNLYLAGDYTQTHWPATMEGAVRSGYLAAEAAHQSLTKRPAKFLIPDLKTQWPARALGL